MIGHTFADGGGIGTGSSSHGDKFPNLISAGFGGGGVKEQYSTYSNH